MALPAALPGKAPLRLPKPLLPQLLLRSHGCRSARQGRQHLGGRCEAALVRTMYRAKETGAGVLA